MLIFIFNIEISLGRRGRISFLRRDRVLFLFFSRHHVGYMVALNEVIQRGRQGNFGERGAASLSMLALLNLEIRTRDRAVPDVILDGDSFRGVLYAPGARRIARTALFYQLVTADGNCVLPRLLTHTSCVVCRARYTLKRKIHWTDARIDSEGRFFHRQRLVALNLVFRAEKERGADI